MLDVTEESMEESASECSIPRASHRSSSKRETVDDSTGKLMRRLDNLTARIREDGHLEDHLVKALDRKLNDMELAISDPNMHSLKNSRGSLTELCTVTAKPTEEGSVPSMQINDSRESAKDFTLQVETSSEAHTSANNAADLLARISKTVEEFKARLAELKVGFSRDNQFAASH